MGFKAGIRKCQDMTMSAMTVPWYLRQRLIGTVHIPSAHIVPPPMYPEDHHWFLYSLRGKDGLQNTTRRRGTMSEFKTYFGNLPPGCREDDPRAPWNEEEPEPITRDEIVDFIFEALDEQGYEAKYKGMDSIIVEGYLVKVT